MAHMPLVDQTCTENSHHLFSFSVSASSKSQLSDRLLFAGCSPTDAPMYMDVRSASVQVSGISANNTVWKHNCLGAKCKICGYCSGVGRFSSSGMGHCVTGQVVPDIFYNHNASHLRRLESSTKSSHC